MLFGYGYEANQVIQAIMRVTDNTTRRVLEDITGIASDGWSQSLPPEGFQRVKGMIGLVPHTAGNKEEFKRYFISLNPENNKTDNPWFDRYWERVFYCSLQGDNPCNVSAQNLSTINRDFLCHRCCICICSCYTPDDRGLLPNWYHL